MLQTLYDKLWQDHLIREEDDGTALLYVDRHLVHEVLLLIIRFLSPGMKNLIRN